MSVSGGILGALCPRADPRVATVANIRNTGVFLLTLVAPGYVAGTAAIACAIPATLLAVHAVALSTNSHYRHAERATEVRSLVLYGAAAVLTGVHKGVRSRMARKTAAGDLNLTRFPTGFHSLSVDK